MSVDGNRGLFEAVDQYAVCRFPADRGKPEEFVHLIWDFASVLVEDYSGYPLDGLGRDVVEADRLGESSNGPGVCLVELGWGGILGEEVCCVLSGAWLIVYVQGWWRTAEE